MRRAKKGILENNVCTVFYDSVFSPNIISFLNLREIFTYGRINLTINKIVFQLLKSSTFLEKIVKPLVEEKIFRERHLFIQIVETKRDFNTGKFAVPEPNILTEKKHNFPALAKVQKLQSGIGILVAATIAFGLGGVIIYSGISKGEAPLVVKLLGVILGGPICIGAGRWFGITAYKMYNLTKIYDKISNLSGNYHSLLGNHPIVSQDFKKQKSTEVIDRQSAVSRI